MKKFLRWVFFGLQVLGVCYAAFIVWLMTVWMMDDGWAYRARPVDWWIVAGIRLLEGVVAAGIVGVAVLAANAFLGRWGMGFARLKPGGMALSAFVVVVFATIVGAVWFLIEKPYM